VLCCCDGGNRLTRINTRSGGQQRVHLPAGTAGGFLWYCHDIMIDHSRFGHEERVAPTPDGEGIDLEGGNRQVTFRQNVVDYNYGPGMLVMDHGKGSNNSNIAIEDSTFVGNGQRPQCCSTPKPTYCGAQHCERIQLAWNNPYYVASGVERVGFFSAQNTSAFGDGHGGGGQTTPPVVTALRLAPLESVVGRPTAWNFSSGSNNGLQGWGAVGITQVAVADGALSGAVAANTTGWVQSPPTWSNAFDAPRVLLRLRLRLGTNANGAEATRGCLAWVVEYDQEWDTDECSTSSSVSGKKGRGKVLPIAGVGPSPQQQQIEVDLRDSEEWGGVVTAIRVVFVVAPDAAAGTQVQQRAAAVRFWLESLALTP
jgi:hypothetical protein